MFSSRLIQYEGQSCLLSVIRDVTERARLRQENEQYDEAVSDVDRVLELRPGLPQAILLRSIINSSAGRFAEAADDVEQLLQRDPQNSELRLQIVSDSTGNSVAGFGIQRTASAA